MYRKGHLSKILLLSLWLTGTVAGEEMIRWTVDHDGVEREYFVHVPENATGKLPVVLAIHGYTSTATGFQFAHDLNRHADQHGYLVIYPQGSHFQVHDEEGGSFRITTWNPFGAAKPEPNTGPQCAADASEYPCPPECGECGECGRCGWASCYDDVGFLDKVLDLVESEYEVDVARVYAVGVSSGGHMLYRLACSRSSRFAAVTPIISQMPAGYICGPSTDLPMIHLFSGLDETIRPDGTAGQDDGFIYESAARTAAVWSEALDCQHGPVPWQNGYSETAGLVCTAYSDCSGEGNEVVSCLDPDGTHNWPEQELRGSWAACVSAQQIESMPDQPHCPPATGERVHKGMDLVWDFFGRYRIEE